MQEEDGNKNLLRSHPRNQRQQIEPRRDIENRGVRDKIYCKDAIEDAGHVSLLLLISITYQLCLDFHNFRASSVVEFDPVAHVRGQQRLAERGNPTDSVSFEIEFVDADDS